MIFFLLVIIMMYGIRSKLRNQSRLRDDFLVTPSIAITFDDLPGVGALREGETRLEMNHRLLKNLKERGVVATGFVNCARIQGNDEILKAWLDAGMELGNHTSNHLDINAVDIDEWIEDVHTCDEILRQISVDSVLFFRYPMLHRGDTIEKRDKGYKALVESGYSIAPVSVDNFDFILSRAYSKAIVNNDIDGQQKIASAYIKHIIDAIMHYQDVARDVCTRGIDHVLLLHVNTLAADHVGKLLDALSVKGFRFISLYEALQDPVYSRKDVYVGRKGLSWLYRIEKDGVKRAIWDDEQGWELEKRFLRQ